MEVDLSATYSNRSNYCSPLMLRYIFTELIKFSKRKTASPSNQFLFHYSTRIRINLIFK